MDVSQLGISKKINEMISILIKPKSKSEYDLLTHLFEKMDIEVQLIEESRPNYETRMAMEDVENKKGIRTKDSQELFEALGI